MTAAAAQLDSIAAAIVAMLGGHEAVATALQAAWPDPTGSLAVLANVPNLLWQAQAAAHLTTSSALIAETATAFETLKAATPNPAEIAENQAEHAALQAANFLGILTPLINLNRAIYASYWVTAASNKYAYAAASAAGVQAIPPMPPPTPTATPVGASAPAVQTPADKSAATEAANPLTAMQSMLPALSQIGSMGGSLGQLGGGGGGLSSVASLGQQALSPMMSMFSGAGGLNGLDSLEAASAASWLSAPTGAGGSVAANLMSAGGGGGGGFGGGGIGGLGPTALRGPVSWASSTVTSAAPGEGTAVSRLAEARAAAVAPGSSTGLGSSGAMMGPMMAGTHTDQDKQQHDGKSGRATHTHPLNRVATLYRAPTGIPVITGTGGAQFHSGGGGGAKPT
jgi:hypothetical protein